MRLAARIGKLEAKMPPPPVGCDACRGRLALGLGQFELVERGGRAVAVCAGCGCEPGDGIALLGVNIAEVV